MRGHDFVPSWYRVHLHLYGFDRSVAHSDSQCTLPIKASRSCIIYWASTCLISYIMHTCMHDEQYAWKAHLTLRTRDA